MYYRDREDAEFMALALEEAKKATAHGDVPVGAVVIRGGEVVSAEHNRREADRSATAHAEVLAIGAACRALDTRRLAGCTLYVTLEPCPMCAGAILAAGLDRIVFGAFDPVGGAVRSRDELFERFDAPSPGVRGGVLADDCAALLSEFFAGKR